MRECVFERVLVEREAVFQRVLVERVLVEIVCVCERGT